MVQLELVTVPIENKNPDLGQCIESMDGINRVTSMAACIQYLVHLYLPTDEDGPLAGEPLSPAAECGSRPVIWLPATLQLSCYPFYQT